MDEIQVGIAKLETPCVLVVSNVLGFQRLASEIIQCKNVNLPIIASDFGAQLKGLVFEIGNTDSQLSVSGKFLKWTGNKSAMNEISEIISGFAKHCTDTGGHQYLDPKLNNTQFDVVLSMNEYDFEKLFKK